MTSERMSPHNRDAERATIGALLRDNGLIADVARIVSPADFYVFAHQKIMEGVLQLSRAGKPVDLVTMASYLKDRALLGDLGGDQAYSYLAELWETAPVASNAKHYAKIVREASRLRHLIHIAAQIGGRAQDQAAPASELEQWAMGMIFEQWQRDRESRTAPLKDALKEATFRIEERQLARSEGRSRGVITGWPDLDELTAGLPNGELTLIAARTSVGKTSFALNLFYNVFFDIGQPALFFSLEQSRVEIGERLLSLHGKIDGHRLRKGTLSEQESLRLLDAEQEMARARSFINDASGLTAFDIAAECRRYRVSDDIRLIIVDYLQLVLADNARDARHEQVAATVRQLKRMARELDVPVVALAQVSRRAEERPDGRPKLSDLRESGALEQDADTVIFLHAPIPDSPPAPDGDARFASRPVLLECDVAKQRNGRTGVVKLFFRKQYMRFENFTVEAPGDSWTM